MLLYIVFSKLERLFVELRFLVEIWFVRRKMMAGSVSSLLGKASKLDMKK